MAVKSIDCIYWDAARIDDAAARKAFLDDACGSDGALRERVEALLAVSSAAEPFLESPPPRLLDAAPPKDVARPVLGPYKLLEQIGEGGFGVVYMAEQTEPVRRKVALKILKPGMDTRQVVARFEAERQALAIMDHPNIAKVLDAGMASVEPPSRRDDLQARRADPGAPGLAGHPYFVMELVKGVAITEYCDQNQLTPRQRLELLIPVCQAVQHAHQKGIIHRDLKPSNVLVTVHDTIAVPKIIDFGIAKALGQVLTDKTLFTGFAQMIGTPVYMSPEQAGQSGLDVDTRSDIYSLGVLLYELLTGTTPFDKNRFKQAAYEEIRRIIREEDPPKPSTRLSESKDSLPSISAQRQTEPAKLTRLVRGELDWIVMKALEKDRNRRYDTANGLAQDLQRYLADEPVQACPPSAWYRLTKFARRHKVALSMVGMLAAVLILAVVTLAVANFRINDALTDKTKALDDLGTAKREIESANANLKKAIIELKEEKGKTQLALDQERLALYSYRVALAQREWYANRVARAEHLLDECPAPLRGWEWHYLKRLCHADLLTIGGHSWMAHAAVFSPDGKHVASSDAQSGVWIWDAATGRKVHNLKGHKGIVYALQFRPDGKFLASGASDTTIRLWDTVSGQEVQTFGGYNRGVLSIAFSPDGGQLVASSDEAFVRIWDVTTGQPARTIPAKRGRIRTVAFSPDGARLAWDEAGAREVVVAEAATGRELHRWSLGMIGELGRMAFSPDGRRLATGGRNGMPFALWDVAGGKQVLTLGRNLEVGDIAFSPDGLRLATAHADQVIRVWDAQSGDEVLVLRGHTGTVHSVAFDRDSARIVSSSSDKTVRIWNAKAPQDVKVGAHDPIRLLHHMAVSKDGKRLALTGDRNTVLLCDSVDGVMQDVLATGHKILTSVSLSPDGRRLATAGLEGTVFIWDLETKGQLARCPIRKAGVFQVVFSPDGELLAVSGVDGKVMLCDAAGKEVRTLTNPTGLLGVVAFSPDGKRLAIGENRTVLNRPTQVRIYEVATGRELHCLSAHEQMVMTLAFRPDGKLLATGSTDRRIKLWDTDTGAEVGTLAGHANSVSAMTFDPDGRRLAAGIADGTIVIWDLTTSREAITLKGGEKRFEALAFLRNGTTLVAASSDGHVRFWDGTPLVAKEAPK